MTKNYNKVCFIDNLNKSFGRHQVLRNINISLEKGSICGIVGANGAGKSTLLRTIAGVLHRTNGYIFNYTSDVKGNIMLHKNAFIPDVPYFLPGCDIGTMAKFLASDIDWLKEMCEKFDLNMRKKISKFTRGNKQLSAILLALSCKPRLLIADEPFEGLDPVMRTAVTKLIVDEVQNNEMSVIIASHSLRELEDLCDCLIILHKGEIIEQTEMSDLRRSMFKGQIAFSEDYDISAIAAECGFDVLSSKKADMLTTFTASGDMDQAEEKLAKLSPVLLNLRPATLEEIFIQRVSEKGYDYSNILGGEADGR